MTLRNPANPNRKLKHLIVTLLDGEELEGAGTFRVHLGGGAVGGLDNSPPDCKRHFEYNRKELAVAAVRSPELFVELGQKLRRFNIRLRFWVERICG